MSKLTEEHLQRLIFTESLDDLNLERLIEKMWVDDGTVRYIPDSTCQIDPRDGELVVYNSSRASRLNMQTPSSEELPVDDSGNCPICQGQTTPVIDVADLSDGFTFINRNLYPIFYPRKSSGGESLSLPLYPDPMHIGRASHGFHFLQWSSSYHHKDWHNMPLEDCVVIMQRLAALERKLLHDSNKLMPLSQKSDNQQDTYGYVSIIKNFGAAAGASLTHGHQQIGFSNIMPKRFYNNLCFRNRHEITFNEYMVRENPAGLTVLDCDHTSLLVPYFMRRPFDMLLLLKDASKRHLYELSDEQLAALTASLQSAIKAVFAIMPTMGKPPSFNLTFNTGPGAGIYIEILPQTQLRGGFEQLGLWVCQADQFEAAKTLREVIKAGFTGDSLKR